MQIPQGLEARRTAGPGWRTWLDRLPRLVDELVEEWALSVDGEATHGQTALVVPVRTAGGRPAMLKVVWPHDEAEHEHVALKHWAGDGAVELLRADPKRFALLLERLHPENLNELWDVEACEIVASLYSRLHVPALPQLRTLSSYVEGWTRDLAALPTSAPVPHRLVEQAVSLGGDFLSDQQTDGVLVHTDLHYGNVLASDREPWLVIDPKPVSGDPHCEVAPLLYNRFEELAGDVRGGTRARLHAVVDTAGLDEDRARDWVVLRMLVLACNRLSDPPGTTRSTPTQELLTMCVAVAKAVQE